MPITPLDREPLPASVDPRLQALFAYWDEKRGGRPYPARIDIDPIDIPALLPHLSLVDVVPGTPRFIYRVVGTKMAELLRRDLTGQPVGTGVKPGELDAVLARYHRVADEGIALYHRDRTQEKVNDYTEIDRLMLPIGESGAGVLMILSIVVPRSKIGADASYPTLFRPPA